MEGQRDHPRDQPAEGLRVAGNATAGGGAARLDALEGIPGVLLSPDTDAFVRNVGRARGPLLDAATVDAFVRDNSWPARIRTLLDLIARANPRMASAPPDHVKLTVRDDAPDR